jgi:hypothetical protein
MTVENNNTFPREISKIPQFNLTTENFPKTIHQDKELFFITDEKGDFKYRYS